MDPKFEYPILKLQQQAAMTAGNLAALKTAAADTYDSLRWFGARQVRTASSSNPFNPS